MENAGYGERYRIVITDLLDDDLAPEREALGELADVEALQAGNETEVQGASRKRMALSCIT